MTKKVKQIGISLAVVSAVGLGFIGCGGGGGAGTVSPSSSTGTSTIDGYVIDDPVPNATVSFIAQPGNNILGTATTDAEGKYSFELDDMDEEYLKVADYIEVSALAQNNKSLRGYIMNYDSTIHLDKSYSSHDTTVSNDSEAVIQLIEGTLDDKTELYSEFLTQYKNGRYTNPDGKDDMITLAAEEVKKKFYSDAELDVDISDFIESENANYLNEDSGDFAVTVSKKINTFKTNYEGSDLKTLIETTNFPDEINSFSDGINKINKQIEYLAYKHIEESNSITYELLSKIYDYSLTINEKAQQFTEFAKIVIKIAEGNLASVTKDAYNTETIQNILRKSANQIKTGSTIQQEVVDIISDKIADTIDDTIIVSLLSGTKLTALFTTTKLTTVANLAIDAIDYSAEYDSQKAKKDLAINLGVNSFFAKKELFSCEYIKDMHGKNEFFDGVYSDFYKIIKDGAIINQKEQAYSDLFNNYNQYALESKWDLWGKIKTFFEPGYYTLADEIRTQINLSCVNIDKLKKSYKESLIDKNITISSSIVSPTSQVFGEDENITFIGSGYSTDNNMSYSWSGDIVSTEKSVTKSFEAGQYSVSFTVTDENGEKATSNLKFVVVKSPTTPTIQSSMDPLSSEKPTTYVDEVTITLDATLHEKLYYELNGEVSEYTNPFKITEDSTLKVFSYYKGQASEIVTSEYKIVNKPNQPSANVDGGTHTIENETDTIDVTLSPNASLIEEIIYTTDGSTPSLTNGTRTTVPTITLSSGTTVVKYASVNSDDVLSDVVTQTYVLTTETYTWQSVIGECTGECGTNNGTQSITVTCEDSNGNTVADSYCDASTKPATTQSCTASQCEETNQPTITSPIQSGQTWKGKSTININTGYDYLNCNYGLTLNNIVISGNTFTATLKTDDSYLPEVSFCYDGLQLTDPITYEAYNLETVTGTLTDSGAFSLSDYNMNADLTSSTRYDGTWYYGSTQGTFYLIKQ